MTEVHEADVSTLGVITVPVDRAPLIILSFVIVSSIFLSSFIIVSVFGVGDTGVCIQLASRISGARKNNIFIHKKVRINVEKISRKGSVTSLTCKTLPKDIECIFFYRNDVIAFENPGFYFFIESCYDEESDNDKHYSKDTLEPSVFICKYAKLRNNRSTSYRYDTEHQCESERIYESITYPGDKRHGKYCS